MTSDARLRRFLLSASGVQFIPARCCLTSASRKTSHDPSQAIECSRSALQSPLSSFSGKILKSPGNQISKTISSNMTHPFSLLRWSTRLTSLSSIPEQPQYSCSSHRGRTGKRCSDLVFPISLVMHKYPMLNVDLYMIIDFRFSVDDEPPTATLCHELHPLPSVSFTCAWLPFASLTQSTVGIQDLVHLRTSTVEPPEKDLLPA